MQQGNNSACAARLRHSLGQSVATPTIPTHKNRTTNYFISRYNILVPFYGRDFSGALTTMAMSEKAALVSVTSCRRSNSKKMRHEPESVFANPSNRSAFVFMMAERWVSLIFSDSIT